MHTPKVPGCLPIAGFILFIITLVLIGIGLPSVSFFIDSPPLLFTTGITAGVILMGSDRQSLLFALRYFADCNKHKEQYAREALAIYKLAFCSFIASGIIAMLITCIHVLKCGMNDPNAMMLGLAIALLNPLYALILSVFAFVGIASAERNLMRIKLEKQNKLDSERRG